jgi:hypothetical protein
MITFHKRRGISTIPTRHPTVETLLQAPETNHGVTEGRSKSSSSHDSEHQDGSIVEWIKQRETSGL